jgi:hypothetical protein
LTGNLDPSLCLFEIGDVRGLFRFKFGGRLQLMYGVLLKPLQEHTAQQLQTTPGSEPEQSSNNSNLEKAQISERLVSKRPLRLCQEANYKYSSAPFLIITVIIVYLVYGQASAHIPCRQSCRPIVCSLALHCMMRYIFRRLSPFFVHRFCEQIVSTKTFQVLLTSRLQNQHAHACYGLINAHALA